MSGERTGNIFSDVKRKNIREEGRHARMFFWPEEHLSELPLAVELIRNDGQRGFILNTLQRYASDSVLRIFRIQHGFFNPETNEMVMRYFNGEGSESLARKNEFVDMVRAIGYTAPKQARVQRGALPRELRDATAGMQGKELYWKPNTGMRGVGMRVLPAGEMPPGRLLERDDYIIQEKMPVKEDYRYWRVIQDENIVWRHCYRSFRTDVVGDGTSTVLQLLRKLKQTPFLAKLITACRNVRLLHAVPKQNEAVELVKVAHDVRGAHFARPDETRVEYLDRFMELFTKDIEHKIGHALPVLCFDIGILDPEIFSRPFDMDQMRKNVVFFECQMPFDPGLDNNLKNAARVIALMIDSRYGSKDFT